MGKCCKCEEYRWEDPQEVVWKDPADGKWYCIFHAPKDEKRIRIGKEEKHTIGQFNDLVYHRLNKAISNKPLGGNVSECDFSGTNFPGNISFTNFNKQNPFPSSGFTDAVFYGSVDFNGVVFAGHCYFVNVTFFDRALFLSSTANEHKIRMIGITKDSMERLCFLAPDLNVFSFTSCKWPNRLGIEACGNTKFINQCACEEVYRAMKQRAVAEHDQPQASHWHYREKLMALKRGGNGIFEAVMLWLYWATSGFGERAVRAGVWLLALVALSFLANSINEPWVWAELPGSAAAGYTMATIPFAKDIPGDGWVKVGRGFWQLLIAVQFTLFALAVRNRFRR